MTIHTPTLARQRVLDVEQALHTVSALDGA